MPSEDPRAFRARHPVAVAASLILALVPAQALPQTTERSGEVRFGLGAERFEDATFAAFDLAWVPEVPEVGSQARFGPELRVLVPIGDRGSLVTGLAAIGMIELTGPAARAAPYVFGSGGLWIAAADAPFFLDLGIGGGVQVRTREVAISPEVRFDIRSRGLYVGANLLFLRDPHRLRSRA